MEMHGQDFTVSGQALGVHINDNSNNTPTTWNWIVNSVTYTDQNLALTLGSGDYNVKLTATNANNNLTNPSAVASTVTGTIHVNTTGVYITSITTTPPTEQSGGNLNSPNPVYFHKWL